MLSHGKLENPFTREALTREECLSLDDHLSVYDPDSASQSVLEAHDLAKKIKISASSSQGANPDQQAQAARELALQREAAVALQSLFQYRRERSTQRAFAARAAAQWPGHDGPGGGEEWRGGGWAVIDDDAGQVSLGELGVQAESLEEFPDIYEGHFNPILTPF